MLSVDQWNRLRRHLLVRQDLAVDTTRKTLATLRTMQDQGFDVGAPRIEHYEDLVERRKLAGARGAGLQHYYKAVRRLLRYHGLAWPDIKCPRASEPEIVLLSDDVVARLLRGDVLVDVDDVERALARFSFQLGFYTGIRPPAETVALRLKDFDSVSGRLHVWAPKTQRARTLQLEPWLAQIVRTYIAGPRAEVDRGITDQLLLNARGRPWTRGHYRAWLARLGKSVSPRFNCYAMRHWALTQRLISWDLRVLPVKRWAGHHGSSRHTERYLHVADAIYDRRALLHEFKPLATA